jgi:predicted phage terminase large subunit-like protein
MILKPQPGPQEEFLSSPADIVIYGGEAGGGKTYGLLLEGIRHIDNRRFGSVLFRREMPQITNEGGPWDTAQDMYTPLGASSVKSPKMIITFPSGSKMTMSHMHHENDMYKWDGAQVALIMWDELQHFTARQFWYMFSRMRSTCGVRPYMRGTCNPDPDSFLVVLLAWWIDQVTGDPIRERSGVIRWLVRLDGTVYWGDSKEELIEKHGSKVKPKSFTFIMSTLEDNQELLRIDPDYAANIEALLDYEKKRLKGNWFARPTAGELFKRQYFEIIEDFDLRDILRTIRYWDRAATEPNESNEDPDWTAGVKMCEMVQGYFLIVDVSRDRCEPAGVEDLIDYNTTLDEEDCVLGLEQEPGASGKTEVFFYVRKYPNLDVQVFPKTSDKSKLTCWKPAARAAKKDKIKILRGTWNQAFLQEAEAVTDGTQPGHDDQIDAFAGAYNYLTNDSFGIGTYKGALR